MIASDTFKNSLTRLLEKKTVPSSAPEDCLTKEQVDHVLKAGDKAVNDLVVAYDYHLRLRRDRSRSHPIQEQIDKAKEVIYKPSFFGKCIRDQIVQSGGDVGKILSLIEEKKALFDKGSSDPDQLTVSKFLETVSLEIHRIAPDEFVKQMVALNAQQKKTASAARGV